jgi:hypothetical protein
MYAFVIYPPVGWVLTFCGVAFFSGFLSKVRKTETTHKIVEEHNVDKSD